MKKRILAGILCFCVILTSLPIAALAEVNTGNPDSNFIDSQNMPLLTPPSPLADDTNYDPDLGAEDDGNGIGETNPSGTNFRGMISIPPSYFLNQDPKQNEDLLEQISSITEENADEIYDALQALGLLDEEGNLNVSQTVNLNGEELTLEQVMDLLEDENTDLSQIASVDGVPIALGDLKTIIQIEMELARIQETYFSGKTFTEEALDNLNSLIEQIERDGIKIHDGTNPSEDEEDGDLVPPTDGEPEELEEGPEEEPEELEEDPTIEAPTNLDEPLGIIQPSSMGLEPSRMQMMGSSTGTSEPPSNELGRLKIVDMSAWDPWIWNIADYDWNSQEYKWIDFKSSEFSIKHNETIEFSYRISERPIEFRPNNVLKIELKCGPTVLASGEKQADGSYKLSYTRDAYGSGIDGVYISLSTQQLTTNINYYGIASSYIDIYDAKNMVFFDGNTYNSRLSLKILKEDTFSNPSNIAIRMDYDNPDQKTVVENTPHAKFVISDYTGDYYPRINSTALSLRNAKDKPIEYRINARVSLAWKSDLIARPEIRIRPEPYYEFVYTEPTLEISDYQVTASEAPTQAYEVNYKNGWIYIRDESLELDKEKTLDISFKVKGGDTSGTSMYLPDRLRSELQIGDSINESYYYTVTTFVHSSSIELIDDDNPKLLNITAPPGTYFTGDYIPIIWTFNELVDAGNAKLEINGETYNAADLSVNSYGNEIVAWYPVKKIDTVNLTVKYLDNEGNRIKDIFGNEVEIINDNIFEPIAGVQLKSTLMRNAPTSFTADFDNESRKASFSLAANMEDAYKTAIYNYHADHGDGDREAPFRIQLYKPDGEEGESLQVYLIDDESDPFSIEDYIVSGGSVEKDEIWLAVLQANEGSRDNPEWVDILPLNREFTVGKLLYATEAYIKQEENAENYTLTLADTSDGELYRPVLQANLRLNDNTTSVPATTGTWSSSDEDIATISNDPDSFGQVVLTGRKLGSVSFSYKPDSENEYIKRNPAFDPDHIAISEEYTVEAGGSIALIIPESASRIITRQINGETPDVNVLWSSNISIFTQGDFKYKVEVFEGDFKTNDALEGQTPLPLDMEGQENFFIVDKDKNSQIIPGRVLTESKNDGTPAYTVRVSVIDSFLSVPAQLAWIVVWPEMAEAKLIPPASIYLTDEETVDIGWTTKGTSENTLTITRVTGDNTTSVFYEDTLTGTSGNYRLNPGEIPAGRLKETYQIRFTVDNPGSSPSIDSFPLYVYNADALDIEVGGEKVDEITLDNLASAISPPDTTSEIMKLRQELGLMEYISINYKDYNWSSFSDGIKWTSSDDDKVSVNYKQGGFYENINLFTYSQYLPETIMAISSVKDGKAKITATHANTGMSASLDVEVKTLRDKLYMFQLTPARETKLTYTDGEGKEKTVFTNNDGILALYEPAGIAGPIYFLSGTASDTYIGTMYKESLQSGERDAKTQQLYPLNRMTLYKPSEARIWFTLPDGSPFKNGNLTVRGGVYKNGDYIPQAGIGSSYNNIKDGKKDQSFTTDEYGFATIYMDSTQFWSEKAGESDQTPLTPKDKVKYVFEIKDIGNDKYYPLLFDVDADLSGDTLRSRYGFWTAALEEVPQGKKKQPFVANQTIDYADEDGNALQVDVRKSTNFIGPNRIHPKARLDTTMYLWGEDINNAEDYTFYMKDDFGYTPLDQTGSQSQYPFSSILIATNSLILDADTMTNSGWIPDGDNRGLKTSLKNKDILVQETTLPFRIIDMTRVAKAEEDDNVIKSVRDMKDGSGAQSSLNFGGSGGLDKILLSLMGNLEDMSGPVDSSSFKLIISPSEDASVFNALIFAGKNTRELEDMDYSQEGIAISTKVFEQPNGLGIAGVGDMVKGGKELKKDLKSKFGSKNLKDVDFGGQLEGYYEAQIRYNFESKEWEVYTLGGGFTAGFGGSIKFNTNLKVGPVPVTAELELGGDIQLDFKTAVRYNEVKGYEWIDTDINAVNDYLTTLRLNAYVYAFGGVGFDYSLVALKIGLYGRLQVDSQNKFLSRTYLEDPTKRQVNGQALGIDGEVGMKFVAVLAGFIEHETILFSQGFTTRYIFNDWNYIEDYWKNRGSGLEGGRSLMRMAAQSGLAMTPPTSSLQSRDYLETYARTWGQPQARYALFALDPESGLKNLQSNANPSSDPAISDDGQIFAYISDSDSSDVYDSRVHYSKLSGTSYQSSEPISSSNSFDFDGYGDSGVSLSGDQNFAAAAWVRLGAKIEGKNENDTVSLAEQNLLMNSTEILASIYKNGNWTSTRLTDDGSPDMAPAVATNANSAVVFWRSVYTADPGTEEDNELLNFKSQDNIMYSRYDGSAWSEAQMLYNGSAGAVKGLEAAMLPDGTAMAVYSLDRGGESNPSDYEIAYSIVDKDGNLVMTMIATHDSNLNQNPQIVSADFGTGTEDHRFVIGWNNVTNEINDIRLLAIDGNGIMSNTFPESLSKLTTTGDAVVGADFKFARLNSSRDSIDDLTILWNEQLTHEETGQTDHSIIRASKLRYADDTNNRLILSAPLEVAELPERTLTNSFDAYVSGENQVKAIVQATWYDDANPENIGGLTVPGEKVMLYTATSNFIEDAVEVESITVDYEGLALNSLVPVSFTVRNIGLNDITGLKITIKAGEIATLDDPLLPNESITLYVWHNVGDKVEDVGYSLTANEDKIRESGTVYMDYSDIGIQSMDVVQEEKGIRTIHLNIYNRSAATLAGKGREVKLAFFTDNLYEDKANIISKTPEVLSSENILTISDEDALKQIDQGAFIVEIDYDLGSYVKNTLNQEEIPETGVYLFVDSWIEGKVGEGTEKKPMPEFYSSDNQASVLLTGAYGRTGEKVSLNIDQGTNDVGHTRADISLRNNSLQAMTGGSLVTSLLGENGNILETQPTSLTGTLEGESGQIANVEFGKLGSSVVVTAAPAGEDSLTFEGLPVRLGDFTSENNYTYTLGNVNVSSTLVTAVSGTGDNVTINGENFSGNGSLLVEIDSVNPTIITVVIGTNTYTLNIEFKKYTLTVNGGTGGGSYTEGATVTITADPAPSGKVFAKWTTADGVAFANANASTTTFTMPAKAVTVTATYKNKVVPIPTYTVTVNGGTGGGSYEVGATVIITADTASEDKVFDKWTTTDGVTFADENAAITTFTMPAKSVIVTATYKDIQATITGVAVTPKTISVQKGTTAQFTAIVTGTGSFDNTVIWSISDGSPGTSIDSSGLLTISINEIATSLIVTATLPGDNNISDSATVTVTVTEIPITKYEVEVNNGTGGGSYEVGATVTITADTAPSGQVFAKWTTADGVAFTNANASTTTFTMPAKAVTVTATYKDKQTNNEDDDTPGGSGSSSSGSSSDIGKDQATVSAANGQVPINYTVSKGIATLSLTTSKINKIIEESKGNEVVIDLSKVKDISAVSLPKKALETFKDAGFDVTLKLPTGTITMDKDAAASIADQSGENLTIELKQVASSTLTDEQKEAIKKDDIVFEINIISGTKKITNFDGSLTFQIPYDGPQPVAVWYLNEKGDLEKLNSIFENGMVTFSTNHLSYYVVGVDETKTEVKWVNPFADVKEDNWFYEAVKYVYENDLMKGTGDNTFSPNEMTTRGMIVTILHRLEDSPSAGANSFSDVEGNKYYANAVAWASENNIVSGYGNGKFGPEDAITREQLATILMNYANYKGYDVSAKADLSKYEDSKEISNWALDAISWANAEGLIQGDGNNLTPTANATRAQVATILNRFIEKNVK